MTGKKKPATRALSSFDELDAAGIGAGYAPQVSEPEPVEVPPVAPTGFLRTQGDRALALGQGVVGGVKMLSDLAGPDNAVSQSLGGASETMQGLYSPARIAEMRGRQAKIDEADASGSTLSQVTSRLGGIAEAPAQTLLQAFGSMAPNIAAAIATGGVSAGPSVMATAARMGLQGAIGAGMGVGSNKGGDYDAVFQRAKQEGQTDEQAKALAIQASEYSAQNAPQQMLAGGLGALGALTGAERFISGMARKGVAQNATQPAQNMLVRGIKGGFEEAIPEGLQGAQGQYAKNEALNNSGFQTDPWQGVVGQGVNDAVIGAMIGGPLGAVHKPHVAEVGPLSRGANQGIDTALPEAPPPPPIAPDRAQALLDNANLRAQALDDKAKGTKGDGETPGIERQFLTPEEKAEVAFLKENGGDAQALAEAYPDLPVPQTEPQTLPQAAPELSQAPPAGDLIQETAPILSQEPAPTTPTAPSARQVAIDSEKERVEAKSAARQAARAAASQAPEGLSVGITPNSAEPVTVKNGIVHIGKYPAQNFDTGEDIFVPEGSSNLQIADALKQANAIGSRSKLFGLAPANKDKDLPLSEAQSSDILNMVGKPFTTLPGAMNAKKAAGPNHDIVRVAGGLVVRKKAPDGAIDAILPAPGQVAAPGRVDTATGLGLGNDGARAPQADQGRLAADLLGQPGEYPAGTDAGALTTGTNASKPAVVAGLATETTPGTGTNATAPAPHVQNPTPPAGTQALATPTQKAPEVASAPAAAQGLPAAGSVAVEAAGLTGTNAKAEEKALTQARTELRKRVSVLKSLMECMA